MRFIDGGPDVPVPLIRALRRGDVLFVVGAGFSRPAGLPMFGELAEQIYAKVGQALPGEPASLASAAEADAFSNRQYDRLLGLLEHRLVYKGAAWRQPTNSVRDTAAALLRIPRRVKLDAQQDLLDLSRGVDGRPRLVTTNFDTLFERAWARATGRGLPSSAGPGMPPVGSHEFSGILHIHGRLEDKNLGLERTDLVLTAPNFGEAYMRNGWASRTIYDLLRRYTVVLIGYSADDPPIRYMLEATEEGRLNFPDLKPAYAFVPDELGNEGSTRELWRAKGLYPIIYEPGATHEPLYHTLREWAASVRDPGGWAAPRIASITARRFAESSPEHRSELAFLAHDVSTIQAVARAASDPGWIEALATDEHKVDDWVYQVWFADRLEQVEAAEYAAALSPHQQALLATAIARIIYLRDPPLTAPYDGFWRLFVQASGRQHNDLPVRLSRREPLGSLTSAHIVRVVDTVTPRLLVGKAFRWPETERTQAPVNIHALARFEFRSSDRDWRDLLKAVPGDAASVLRLLKALDRRLGDTLDLAADTGLLGRDGDLLNMDVKLVHDPDPGEPLVEAGDRHGSNWRLNPPDQYNNRFAPIVRLMTALWTQLYGLDRAAAARLAGDWGRRDLMILRRMGAWAALECKGEAFDAIESYLRRVTRARYWFGDNNPEIVRFYCRSWARLRPDTRAAIERAILGGPLADFTRSFARDGRRDYLKAFYTVRELVRITTAGGRLSRSTATALRRLQRAFADLPATMPLYANLVSPSWSGFGYSANTRVLAGVPADELIATAERFEQLNPFDQRDLWRAFAENEPVRAYEALANAAARGEIAPENWQPLLYHFGYRQARPDPPETPPLSSVLDLVLIFADEPLAELLYPLINIIEANMRTAGVRHRLLKLWDRLLPLAVKVDDDDAHTKPLSERIVVHPVAELAKALMNVQWLARRAAGSGLSPRLAPRFSALIGLEGDAGWLARGALAQSIAMLDYLAPEWSEDHLFAPMLDSPGMAGELVIIAAQAGCTRYARIFNRLKPALLRTLEEPDISGRAGTELAGALLTAAIATMDKPTTFELSKLEARRALTRMPDDLLAALAWELGSVLRHHGKDDDPAEIWGRMIEPFLLNYWPNDVAARTPEVTRNLARLPSLSGTAFARATGVVLGLVVPIEVSDIDYGLGLDEEVLTAFPRASLELIAALVDPNAPAPIDLASALATLIAADAAIGAEPQFWRLRQMNRER